MKFYYDLLYDYPFGGVEIQNMRSVMDFVTRPYPGVRATKTPEEMVDMVAEFPYDAADAASSRAIRP